MPVIGCCNSPPNLVVISQYIPIGSLFQVLHEQVGNTQSQAVVIDTTTALQFAHDVAKGMAFLHSLDRQMPRFHLNSKHVMVRNDLRTFCNANYYCNKIQIRESISLVRIYWRYYVNRHLTPYKFILDKLGMGRTY